METLELTCFGQTKQFSFDDIVKISIECGFPMSCREITDITGRITFIGVDSVEIDCSERFYSNIVNVRYEDIVNITLVEEE